MPKIFYTVLKIPFICIPQLIAYFAYQMDYSIKRVVLYSRRFIVISGAFFIPYIAMMVFIGTPLYYLELALGQYSSRGPTAVWDCVPLLRGTRSFSHSLILPFFRFLNLSLSNSLNFHSSIFV